MNSFFELLGLTEDISFNVLIIVPIIVFVSLVLLLKLSVRKQDTQKSQNIKNQAKVSTPKQKQNKTNNEKRSNKKDTSVPVAITDKSSNVNKVATKSDKQKLVVNENSPKKSAQTNKKQQVNTSNVKNTKNTVTKNQKNAKHPAEIFISKEEEGEWQMVTTKKQKQNKNKEVPADIIEIPTKTNKKETKKPAKKKSNKEIEIDEATDNSTKFTATTIDNNIADNDDKTIFNDVIAKVEHGANNFTEIVEQVAAKEMPTLSNDNSKIYSKKSEEEKNTSNQHSQPNNVAFDELGDEGWKDSKPQKKNRRKALRE